MAAGLQRGQAAQQLGPHAAGKFAELHRQRAGDAAQTTSTTTEIN